VGAGAFQAFDDVFLGALQVVGDVGDGGGSTEFLRQGGGGLVDVEFEFLQPAGYPDVPGAVAEVAFDFADDGGYRVGGEVVAVFGVEPVDGFDQSDGGDLDQVVDRLTPAVEALGQVLGQRQPRLDRTAPDGG